jgi:hypothetical protein
MADVTEAVMAYGDQCAAQAVAPLQNQIKDLQQNSAAQPPLPAGWGTVEFFGMPDFNVRNATTQNNTYCNNFARNVTRRDGATVITGRRETTTVQTGSGPRTCAYSSGYVDTSGGRLSVEKGSRLEIRAILPALPGKYGLGSWGALWGRDNTGPGEVDLAEAWGGDPTAPSTGEIYRPGSFSSSIYANTNDRAAGNTSNWGTSSGYSPRIGWSSHNHWLEWDNDGMRIGVDENAPHVNARYATTPWLASAFPSTLQLRLCLQIGSAYWGSPTADTVFPMEMVIHSVRVLRP